jgi:hypothetical protein
MKVFGEDIKRGNSQVKSSGFRKVEVSVVKIGFKEDKAMMWLFNQKHEALP